MNIPRFDKRIISYFIDLIIPSILSLLTYFLLKHSFQILDYLTEIGLNNIKDILKYKTNIFYEKLNNIKKSFEDRKDVVKLINEDITNFELIWY